MNNDYEDRDEKQWTEDGNGNGKAEIGGRRRPRRGDGIARRLLDLSAASLTVAGTLPKDFGGKHIATQLIRSATSAGANYEEARAAESRPDFIHKIGVAAKELRETTYWLSLVEKQSFASVAHLLQECDELTAILIASARTARSRT